MRDHFRWRPGWRPDRPYLTWHVLPVPADRDRAAGLAVTLDGVPHLAPVRADRLHVTGPGVGFADELPDDRVDAMVAAARSMLGALPPVDATIEPPVASTGGVGQQVVHPGLGAVRTVLRDAMRVAAIEPPGADDEPCLPHLTLAYPTGPASVTDARIRLPDVGPAAFRVDAVHLLALRMVPPGYEWTVPAVVPLAG